MYGQFAKKRYYRCVARDWDKQCSQSLVLAELVEVTLGELLMSLELPKEWQDRALDAVDDLLNQKQLRDRTEEIKQIIDRLDMRWDMGFMNKEEYVQKRTQFQQELEGMQPLPRAMLEESLRVFRDFRKMWEEGDLYQRKHLLGLVVEKVWVKGSEISAITLRPSYHLVVTGLKKAVEDNSITVEGAQDGKDNEKEKTTQQFLLGGSDGSDGCGVIVYHIWHHSRPAIIQSRYSLSRQRFVLILGLFTCICAEIHHRTVIYEHDYSTIPRSMQIFF
jgi:hypothetical protein